MNLMVVTSSMLVGAIVINAALAILAHVRALRLYTHMAQLEGYELSRYWRWLWGPGRAAVGQSERSASRNVT